MEYLRVGFRCSRSVFGAKVGLLLLILLWSSSAPGYEIPAGTATVDGDLSDWADADWIAMEQIYYGDPTDMSGAKWAAKWTPNMVYLAATVVDSDHVLLPTYVSWDGQDCIEVYIDPGNRNIESYQETFADAQQYVFASTGVDSGEWLALGNTPVGPDQTAVPELAVSVVGDVINYEIAMRPYDFFNKDDPPSSTLLTLGTGMVIGLDVVIDSRTSAGGFGMLCENMMEGKWYRAVQMQRYTLVGQAGALDGDLNGDGAVNSADLDIVRGNWGQSVSGAANGDPSGDGAVGSADLDIVRANWGRTAAASAIPEPGMIALLVALAGICAFRRR